MSDQEDGLFGFDFDEQDFVTKQPTKVEIEKIHYEAKIETDGVSQPPFFFFKADTLEH